MRNKEGNLILLALLCVIVFTYLLFNREKEGIEAARTPLQPIILPPHLQDMFRRMEDGEIEDRSVDEVLEGYDYGGLNNGHGGKVR